MKTNTETKAKKYQENVLIPKINVKLADLFKEIDIFLEKECELGKNGFGVKTKAKVKENLQELVINSIKTNKIKI